MVLWREKENRVLRLDCVRCRCYILQHAGYNILVDTSMKFERKVLTKSLNKYGITHIDAVILTHNHSDHAANAHYIQERYQCPVYASESARSGLETGVCQIPDGRYSVFKVVCWLAQHTPFRHLAEYEPCQEVRDIQGEEAEKLLGSKIQVLATPGHTEDSISLIIADQIALVGDAFIRYPWMKHVFLPFADKGMEQEIAASWKKLADTKCSLFCQAHGNTTTRKMLCDTCR